MVRIYFNPFLFTDGKKIYNKNHVPILGLQQVKANRHHLYPRARTDIIGLNKEKFLLRLWEYKHFKGWNILFSFIYTECGIKRPFELSIDEIITLMVEHHPFITDKVGSPAWKIVFKEMTLDEATDLLCRMLAWKFNYQWQKVFPEKITLMVRKTAA